MSTYAPVLVSDRPSDALAEPNWQASPSRTGSPLATATAVSALLLAEQHDVSFSQLQAWNDKAAPAFDTAYQGDLSELIVTSLHWLAQQQHADGGWGEGEASELATTMLVRAAFQITGVPVQYADLVERADTFVKAQDGTTGLRTQCDHDKSRIAPILASCALAGSISWRQVPALPFERICLPTTWTTRLHLATECTSSPSALAVGLAKFHHDPPRNPIMRVARQWSSNRVLPLLQQAQSSDGGFLGSVPQTSFVVMSLASMGHAHLPLVRRSVEFLFSSLRPDGSWPNAVCPTT